MPRGPRIVFENAFYHVFNRGLNKQVIFTDEQDYSKFLTLLHNLRFIKKFDHTIYSYVLIPNHFHILIQTRKTPISKIMSSLLTSYSMYFNKKNKRVGVLFQNRFKSKLCDRDSYFLGASRYIHLNPLKDGLVSYLSDYLWSSYQEIFGQSKFNIIDREAINQLIGETKKDKKRYLDFLDEGIQKINEYEEEYPFNKDIDGKPLFTRISQIKFLRRRNRKLLHL